MSLHYLLDNISPSGTVLISFCDRVVSFLSTGASWGCNDIDQTDCCYGCGTDQEEFYNCADVSIAHGTGNNDQSFEQQHDEQLKFKRYIAFEENLFICFFFFGSDTCTFL